MSQDANRRVDAAIRNELAPILRSDGFLGSGRNFRRVRGELIHALNVQGSRQGGQFAVNLGVHFVFLPDVCGVPVVPKELREPQCELRRRMSEHGVDQWWHHGTDQGSIDAATRSATAVYLSHGRQQFETLGSYPDSFTSITAGALATGTAELAGFKSTLVRMALLFAQLRLHEGSLEPAREFAALGLASLGSAVGLRRRFEEIIEIASP